MFARCCAVSRITFGRVKLQRNRIIPIIVTMMLGDNSDFIICLIEQVVIMALLAGVGILCRARR